MESGPGHDPPPVAARWQTAGSGAHYAGGRFRTRRARERDPRLVARLLSRVQLDDPLSATVLDVPCGTGRLRSAATDALRRRGDAPAWAGADVSESMLREVDGRGGALVCASAGELPFATDAFDVVVCCRLLHHLIDAEERRAVLAELVRVARSHVVASYWDAATYQAWRRRTKGPLRRRGRAETRRAVEWRVLREEIEAQGARVVGRAHSLRFVSQQAFFLADVRAPAERAT
ncbi:MAG: class I SAM-dependent methyltransferase [Planctomycetota bacterium]